MIAPFSVTQRAADLRRAFDEAFAAAPVVTTEEHDDFLAVRVAGDPYALRARDISGVALARKIVPVPSPNTHLLGVAGIRGALVPVYSAASLLGYATGDAPLWLALCGAHELVALALSEVEGYLRVRRADVGIAGEGAAVRRYLAGVVRVETLARPVIDVPSILEALKVPVGRAGPEPKER